MALHGIYLRQLDLLTPDKCDFPIHVIGAGATGSFTVLALAKMGFSDITVYDKDTIEEHNFPNQLFPLSQMGENKALALQKVVKDFTNIEIKAIPEMYKNQKLSGVVISALDSMSGRKMIYDNIKDNKEVKLLIDPRCGAEVLRMFTLNPELSFEKTKYEETLCEDSETLQTPCTARSIIYTVLVISALIAQQVKIYTMDEEYKNDILYDMKSNMFFAN